MCVDVFVYVYVCTIVPQMNYVLQLCGMSLCHSATVSLFDLISFVTHHYPQTLLSLKAHDQPLTSF